MDSTDLSYWGCERKISSTRAALYLQVTRLNVETGACPCEAGDRTGTHPWHERGKSVSVRAWKADPSKM